MKHYLSPIVLEWLGLVAIMSLVFFGLGVAMHKVEFDVIKLFTTANPAIFVNLLVPVCLLVAWIHLLVKKTATNSYL